MARKKKETVVENNNEIATIEEIVLRAGSDDVATFGGIFEGGVHIQQIPDEIIPCIAAIEGNIESYLEIGVAAGGTTYLFNKFFQPGKIVLIDDNKHHKTHLRASILEGIKYTELIGLSSDESIVDKVKDYAPFDIIFIDGNHDYPNVKCDVETYLPMLKGYLLLHDSAVEEWGVVRVVRELKNNPSLKFIGEYKSKTMRPLGLALFRKV